LYLDAEPPGTKIAFIDLVRITWYNSAQKN